jgi:hypothetical protein
VLCSSQTIINISEGVHAAAILRCKCWSCELCRPTLHARQIQRITDGKPTKFVTLTCLHGKGKTPRQAHDEIVRKWRVLRQKIARRQGVKTIPFYLVFEKHKSGWPHAHILCVMDYVDQKWLSAEWKKLTGAPIVHIRAVKNLEQDARYLGKYLLKDMESFGSAKRYYCSRNWPKAKAWKEETKCILDDPWRLTDDTLEEFADAHERNGWERITRRDRFCAYQRPAHHYEAHAP